MSGGAVKLGVAVGGTRVAVAVGGNVGVSVGGGGGVGVAVGGTGVNVRVAVGVDVGAATTMAPSIAPRLTGFPFASDASGAFRSGFSPGAADGEITKRQVARRPFGIGFALGVETPAMPMRRRPEAGLLAKRSLSAEVPGPIAGSISQSGSPPTVATST
ncbi:MAG: hypothetical protein KatS3mg076_1661 [Candidatus Binatia bacterium]|nr:MAG: hypothetical protein KatS3mg076_1661 [Candidatus Binatia bacterium]